MNRVPTGMLLMVTMGAVFNGSDTSNVIDTLPTVVAVGWAVMLIIVGKVVS